MIERRDVERYVRCLICDNCVCICCSCGGEIWSHSVGEFRESDITTLSTAFRHKDKNNNGVRKIGNSDLYGTQFTHTVLARLTKGDENALCWRRA